MAAILEAGKLTLSGDVGEFYFGEGFTHSDVVVALAQIDDRSELTVHLNSGGGYASDGAAIHALLSRRSGATNVVIEGVAASAASLIAMAGDTVTMSAGSVMMIHDPANMSVGTAGDHAKSIEYLEALATSFARVYADKSGKTPEECRAIMRAETWFAPDEAVAAGFADGTTSAGGAAVAAFDYRAYANAPKRLKALASKKKWRLPDAEQPAPATASTRQTKENPMTDVTTAAPSAADIEKAKADGGRDAVAAFKARRTSIMKLDEAKGREGLADELIDTDLPEDRVKAMLAAAPKASATTVAELSAEDLARARMGGGIVQPNGAAPSRKPEMKVDLIADMKRRHGVN